MGSQGTDLLTCSVVLNRYVKCRQLGTHFDHTGNLLLTGLGVCDQLAHFTHICRDLS